MEISQIIYHFLNTADPNNKLWASPTGKRKREIGLVLRGRYVALTNNFRVAEVLHRQLEQRVIVEFIFRLSLLKSYKKMLIFFWRYFIFDFLATPLATRH